MEIDKLEGRNPVMEALRAGREVDKILVLKGASEGSIKKIIGAAKDKGIPIQYVEKAKLNELSESDSHQGVIAFVAAHHYSTVEDIVEKAKKNNKEPFILLLDEIMDPHNLGSIMRTADAVGVDGIIIPKRRSVGLTAVVAKTSAGAVEYVPVAKVSNIAQTIDKLKDEGIWVAGADMSGEKEHYYQDLKGPIALVIGSEGKGISRLIKEKCDFIVKLPMVGKIESLNASVAAAILMYEVFRQRSMKG
ncbi:23S rRNA (guanosine(2251)-2'-O)-methyltransferase RlmB [Alkaliphilus peptidifermentans]|uniref:23S rRNA (Guanosine2251-2'-O)-methyltransferase n=1 Tax=Alkaliphilus peptidifermentans DSM 18978 TaxID=1120976 RepID=A0A1G5LCA8_9FIRM|nr:23S rRNA (guanosine(2251)-2'-O)-methyltransferase RlmB [Alkaliphilus peptidifermentans]SCZ09779.1 23S rRNA (guanosine2251-2'-O)-methyltransferase [Alkaliphilus peptidifermentans DSM 18978]